MTDPSTSPRPTAIMLRAWQGQRRNKVLTLAIPIILANISVPLVGMVDTAVMGRMADPVYMGAVALGATIFSSIFWLFGFLRMGTGGLIAQAAGNASVSATATNPTVPAGQSDPVDLPSNKDFDAGSRQIELTLYRALLTGALLGILLVLLQYPIAQIAAAAFSAGQGLETLMHDYFYIRIYAAPATLITYSVIGALIGLQQMRAVLLVQLLLNLSNILLTILFFVVFDAGVKGVALATVIAEYLSLVYGLVVLAKYVRLFPLRVALSDVLDPVQVRDLFMVNSNLLIRTLCLTFAFYWLTETSLQLGELVLAANVILLHMLHFSSHALDGFAHAAETLTGNAYGRARKLSTLEARATTPHTEQKQTQQSAINDFRESVAVCTIWATLFSLLFVLFFVLGGSSIIALMTTQESVRSFAEQWLWWIVFSPLIGVWSFMLDGIFIGVTHTRDMRNAMLQSLVIFLLANLVLISLFGNAGLWASYYVLMIARTATLYRTYPRIIEAMGAQSAKQQ